MLVRFASTACGVALCVPLLEWCFLPHLTFGYLVAEYCFSLVYALLIGGLLSAAMPILWRRSSKWPWATRWLARVSTLVAADALGCLMAGLVPLAVYGHNYGFWQSYVASFKIGLILCTVALTFLVAYERMRERLTYSEMELKTKELERQRALKLATDARLSSLESRMRPHFLFNTLNSVSSLIPEDPKRAERMLTQMANLLRFSLDPAQTGLVPLEREVKITEDYLDIEQARFGDRLRYEISVQPELTFASVPPLALQTLAENSVKYAVGARRQGATIRIWGMAEDGNLILEVCDDGPGFRAMELPSGHGLNNLQERLAVVFGGKARLEIASAPQGTAVRMEMPLIFAASSAGVHSATDARENIALRA